MASLEEHLGQPGHKGKVRNTWRLANNLRLIRTTRRTSALNFKIPQLEIPDKGAALTAMSVYWHELLTTHNVATTHVVGYGPAVKQFLPEAVQQDAQLMAELRRDSMIVHECDVPAVEAIVRNHLVGSGWDYVQNHGTLFGQHVPARMDRGGKLDRLYYTPTAKSLKDEWITTEEAERLCPGAMNTALRIARFMFKIALDRGLIYADIKFEFGWRIVNGILTLILVDEIGTPESSRIWLAEEWLKLPAGGIPTSYDKDPVRKWLKAEAEKVGITLDEDNPEHHEFVASLECPDDLVMQVNKSYHLIYRMLTGRNLDDWGR